MRVYEEETAAQQRCTKAARHHFERYTCPLVFLACIPQCISHPGAALTAKAALFDTCVLSLRVAHFCPAHFSQTAAAARMRRGTRLQRFGKLENPWGRPQSRSWPRITDVFAATALDPVEFLTWLTVCAAGVQGLHNGKTRSQWRPQHHQVDTFCYGTRRSRYGCNVRIGFPPCPPPPLFLGFVRPTSVCKLHFEGSFAKCNVTGAVLKVPSTRSTHSGTGTHRLYLSASRR